MRCGLTSSAMTVTSVAKDNNGGPQVELWPAGIWQASPTPKRKWQQMSQIFFSLVLQVWQIFIIKQVTAGGVSGCSWSHCFTTATLRPGLREAGCTKLGRPLRASDSSLHPPRAKMSSTRLLERGTWSLYQESSTKLPSTSPGPSSEVLLLTIWHKLSSVLT